MAQINVTPPTPEALRPAAQQAAAAAAQAAQAAAQAQPAPDMSLVLLVLAAAAAVVTALTLYAKRWQAKVRRIADPVPQLRDAIRSRPDAVGIIIDPVTGRVRFHPLRRVGAVYVYTVDGARRVFIPTLNKVYALGDMPARIGIEYGPVAMEEDPCRLAAIALGRALLGPRGEVFDQQMDPKRAMEELLDKLAGMEARVTGRLPALDGVAFEVSQVELLRSVVAYIAELNAMGLEVLREAWAQIEETGQAVAGRAGLLREETGRFIFWLVVAGFVAGVLWLLSQMLPAAGPG